MGCTKAPLNPWIETPCLRSVTLSRKAGCNIYLKLENLQPSGSFKSRGLGHMMTKAMLEHGTSKPVRFYCSSGGNAGLACATAAMALGRSVTIVVPMITSQSMCEKLRKLNAEVIQVGENWAQADTYLREHLLANDDDGVYVPPFDHPDIWAGHSTLIDEVEKQMAGLDGYDAVVCSVGGGGLFCGIMEGLEKHGRLQDGHSQGAYTKVLVNETTGTASLAASLREGKVICLPSINGIAISLGATQIAAKAYEWAQKPDVTVNVLSDAQAAMGAVSFADDERLLVEAACGVTIATAYNGDIRKVLFSADTDIEFSGRNVILVVCGGSHVMLDVLESYKREFCSDETVLNRWAK